MERVVKVAAVVRQVGDCFECLTVRCGVSICQIVPYQEDG
jgi:hypothetical protein